MPLGDLLKRIFAEGRTDAYQGRFLPLWATPVGTHCQYSNLGLGLIGYLVERLNPDGASFPDWLRRRLFAPLGMTSTCFPSAQHPDYVPADILGRRSTGYVASGSCDRQTAAAMIRPQAGRGPDPDDAVGRDPTAARSYLAGLLVGDRLTSRLADQRRAHGSGPGRHRRAEHRGGGHAVGSGVVPCGGTGPGRHRRHASGADKADAAGAAGASVAAGAAATRRSVSRELLGGSIG